MQFLFIQLVIIILMAIFGTSLIESFESFRKCRGNGNSRRFCRCRASGFTRAFCNKSNSHLQHNCICGNGQLGVRSRGYRGRCLCNMSPYRIHTHTLVGGGPRARRYSWWRRRWHNWF